MKKMKDKQELQELFAEEYLGLENIHGLHIVNPFDLRTQYDIENPHLFLLRMIRKPENIGFTAKHIFNKELASFQLVILQELWHRKYPMLIGSRGASKSWLLALYAMMRALHHQGCKIIIVGAAFRQAKVVFEYCEALWHDAPILRNLVKGADRRQGPRRDIDRCTLTIGDSMIIALPLGNGDKIRGQRANYIIADEFASIPKDIYETVVSGFAAVSSDPIDKVKEAARIRVLKREGCWDQQLEAEHMLGLGGNQAIISGTANYGFNHFADYWKQYKAIIESKGDINKLREIFNGEIPSKFDWKNYSIIRIPVELLPDGFMDETHVARAKAVSHISNYMIEYGACFPIDSNGFFKRSLIESCVTNKPIELPVSGPVKFTAMLKGNPKKRYIFGVDPASERDNFSIDILEENPDHRKQVYCWTTTRQVHKERIKEGLVKQQSFYGYCARKIRSLMYDFPCVHIALDSQGGGIAVAEALNDPDNMLKGEEQIWPVIDEDEEKDTDGNPGLHILEMVNFADAKYTREANHGLRKDMEDKALLFPFFDSLSLSFAAADDKAVGREYDTMEDCVMEIEELKEELSTIVHTQTANTGRDKWDTPQTQLAGGKKGHLRKDRYSALLMANMAARIKFRTPEEAEYKPVGGFVGQVDRKATGNLYIGPAWFTQHVNNSPVYGACVRRGVS
jgi:hypothetical protein